MNSPAPQSSTLFAYEVSQQLHKITRELIEEAGIKAFCSALADRLANIQEDLKKISEQPGKVTREPCKAVGEPRLLKLLDNLEALCLWPARLSGSPCSGDRFDRRRYPSLIRLLKNKQVAKQCIRDFAFDHRMMRERGTLLQLLANFAKPNKDARGPELAELGSADMKDQYDNQAYVRALYANLASHSLCTQEDGRKGITANLRLNRCCAPGELEDSVNFRLFFLDHPHQQGTDDISYWQDTQICVLRKRRSKFENEQASDNSARSGKVISMDSFCEIITNRKRTQLKLAILDDSLVLLGPGGLSQSFYLGESSVSLAEILGLTELSQKMRLLLSCFLAKAFWQFYDSEWMRREWTKETVHFMFERRSNTPKGIFVNEPFLASHFDGRHQSPGEDDNFRSHPFPKILALGIILLEIEFGIKIEEYRMPEDLDPDGEPTVNADHIAAMEVFNTTELWEKRETFGALRDLIKNCLIPDEFNPFSKDVEGLRDVIKKHIVEKLWILYKEAWEDPDTSQVRAIELGPSTRPFSRTTNDIAPYISPFRARSLDLPPETPKHHLPYHSPLAHSAARVYEPSLSCPEQSAISLPSTPLPDAPMSASFTTDSWFEQLDTLNSVLRPKPKDRDSTYQPVKIAILDTGASPDLADSIKDFRDFVSQGNDDNDDDLHDNTGHGSSAIRLIQKVYHMAEIYVGRVFDNSRASDNTAGLMAEAIRHAKETWVVDIIVMPSGFRSEDSEMERAIEEARHADILIFTAASNYGNICEIAFPGRLYIDSKLFCMFSTDSNVRAFPGFNPSALSRARYSFAILGENIKLPNWEKVLSGTSFAAMIGGAVAGRILDFSRHKDNRERIRRIEKLHTVEGMSAVFESMVVGGLDNGYHCMAPWKIIPPEIRGEEAKQTRLRQRAHICETISRALEDMHRR